MLMPSIPEPAWLAPCGMNCLLCYKHLGKKPCGGCLMQNENKPQHCRVCNIKQCTAEQGVPHCFACAAFPCKQIKALDKSYRTRYGVSLAQAGLLAQEQGVEAFLQQQMQEYTCARCGGVISLHDGDCSVCGAQYPLGRRSVKP